MSSYGVTEKGFVLKRMDTIMEEVHAELSEGFGFDTRLSETSFLNVLVTSFCGQIANLWETAQDEYYAKYPTTATGVNLDNAVQFGGIRRKPSSHSMYPLHCTGVDGTVVREDAMVATDTNPEIRLTSAKEFTITREKCNSLKVKVAAPEAGAEYIVVINGSHYNYVSTDAVSANILNGLKETITHADFDVAIDESGLLEIKDHNTGRNNVITLSDNLTTSRVTTIASFYTEEYGRITLPNGIVTKMVNNIAGFDSVINMLEPIYGRLRETDIELRQSYIARSAIRSNTMIDSIVGELLSNVAGVESACGYENCTDVTNERGMPPHSIEIIVEGGDETTVAEAILRKKAGGIQTFGSIEIEVAGNYGDTIPVRFNRPEQLYTWFKVVLHGDNSAIPANYEALTVESILEDTENMVAGNSLLTQLLTKGIYNAVSGITYIDIYTAYSTDEDYVPTDEDYVLANVMVTTRQKVLVAESRIEVSLYDGS